MAITYVGGQTAFILGSTTADETVTFSLTGGLASTPAADDLVVVCVAASRFGGAGVTSLVTTGYTSTTRLVAEDAQDSASQVHYKFMGGTPDTTVVITRSGATDSGQAYTIHVFRGVDLTTPLDVTTTTATGIDTGRPNPAAITPSTAGAWIYIGTGDAAATGVTFTYGDFTAVLSTVCDESSNDAVVGSGYYDGWTSGAYDPAASTTGSTSLNSSWTATTMAFRPASGGSVESGAWSSTASSAAAGGTGGASISAQNWSASSVAAVTGGGASIDAQDWSASATATVTWGGASIDAQNWRSVAQSAFPPFASRWNGASTVADPWNTPVTADMSWGGEAVIPDASPADGSMSSSASMTMTGASVAAAGFDMSAAAALGVVGVTPSPSFDHITLDGRKPRLRSLKDSDDEDLMFITAAIVAYMEQNNVHY